METEVISVGMMVRYPRTGTSGKVEHISEIDGELFAEVDSTHLFYRVDQLIPVDEIKKHARTKTDFKEELEKEKRISEEQLRSAYDGVDGCGAG